MKICLNYLFVILVILFTPLAADTPNTSPVFPSKEFHVDENEDDHFTHDLMQMLSTLGLLLAVVLIGSWFLRRMMHSRVQSLNTTSEIKILEQRPLTPKTSIFLLEIRGKGIVMAESVNGVSHLANFTPNTTDMNTLEGK